MQIPQDLIETAALKLKSIQSEAEFFQLRAKFLGKKSFVASSFSKLRDLKPEEKVILDVSLLSGIDVGHHSDVNDSSLSLNSNILEKI